MRYSARIAPQYEVRFIRPSQVHYVSMCWHASRAYGSSRHERLLYVVRHFVRKFPEYEGRATAVYKDVCGLLENA